MRRIPSSKRSNSGRRVADERHGAQMRHEGEPSVEEILESIKKVIARDNRDMQRAERRRRENAGVLLTPGKPTDTNGDELEDELEHDLDDELGHDDSVLELGDAGELVEPVAGPSAPGPGEAGLTTESAARSMRDSLAALAMIAEPGAAPQIVRSGETSLEGLTRELLRPM